MRSSYLLPSLPLPILPLPTLPTPPKNGCRIYRCRNFRLPTLPLPSLPWIALNPLCRPKSTSALKELKSNELRQSTLTNSLTVWTLPPNQWAQPREEHGNTHTHNGLMSNQGSLRRLLRGTLYMPDTFYHSTNSVKVLKHKTASNEITTKYLMYLCKDKIN